MRERAQQFWVGLFVILSAALFCVVLSWFGELPALFREKRYLVAAWPNANGMGVGTSIYRSGIRVGQVVRIAFDERPGRDAGVLVTLEFDREFPYTRADVPQVTRGLLGETTVEMLASDDQTAPTPPVPLGKTPDTAPVVEGVIRADPAKALELATETISRAGETLVTINEAAKSLGKLTSQLENTGEFIDTWTRTGKSVETLAADLQSVVEENRERIGPAIENLRKVAEQVADVLDEDTRARFRQILVRLDGISQSLEQARPLFEELGDTQNRPPKTQLAQTAFRLNRIAADLNLLTATLNDGKGRLNPNGTLQRLLASPDLALNAERLAANLNDLALNARVVLEKLNKFADKIAADPAAITRGALAPR